MSWLSQMWMSGCKPHHSSWEMRCSQHLGKPNCYDMALYFLLQLLWQAENIPPKFSCYLDLLSFILACNTRCVCNIHSQLLFQNCLHFIKFPFISSLFLIPRRTNIIYSPFYKGSLESRWSPLQTPHCPRLPQLKHYVLYSPVLLSFCNPCL